MTLSPSDLTSNLSLLIIDELPDTVVVSDLNDIYTDWPIMELPFHCT